MMGVVVLLLVFRYDVGGAASLCLRFWLHFKFQILTLKPPTKMQPKVSSAKVVCYV